jgi:hypothetical protein
MTDQLAVDHLTDAARPTELDEIALGIRTGAIDHAA